jgi:hypothetical protein
LTGDGPHKGDARPSVRLAVLLGWTVILEPPARRHSE